MGPWAGCSHQAGLRQGAETGVLDAGPGSCKMFHVMRKCFFVVFLHLIGALLPSQ